MLRIFKKELPFFWAIPAFMWQIVFLYIPFIFLVFLSIARFAHSGEFTGITFEYFLSLLRPEYMYVVGRSLILAFLSALSSICIGYPVAYYLALRVQRFKNMLLFFLMLPFWTNFLVQIYAWFFVLEQYGVLNSLLLRLHIITQPLHILNSSSAIYLVMIYCYLPFAVMPIYTILEKIDMRLLEASSDLGACGLKTLFHITLPLSWSGIITGFFLVFIPGFGEFVIPALMGGGKQFYVGSLITHYILEARNQNMGSAFTCVSGFVLIISIILLLMLSSRIMSRRVK